MGTLTLRVGYDRYPDPFFVDRDCQIVNVSDKALKCIAFLGIKKDGRFLPRATCFFVQILENQHRFNHLVTAEHVVSGLLTKNYDIWLRVNLSNGKTGEVALDAQKFRVHPDNEREATDVAVYPMNLEVRDEETGDFIEMDAASIVLNGEGSFLPSDDFVKQYMGRGGEIAIIGLFRSHFGANKNIPIVRVGNISMLPEEPVFTSYAGYMKAYLVEARSIAGLSGSPVFAFPDLALELAKGFTGGKRVGGIALIGLMHGHFDVRNLNEDVVTDEDAPERSVHTGIGIVIPVEKIVETINHPELVAMRKKIVNDLRESGATADIPADIKDP